MVNLGYFIFVVLTLLTVSFPLVKTKEMNEEWNDEVFQIIKDKSRIEEMAVEYAQYGMTRKSFVAKFARKVKKNICNRSRQRKIIFCEDALQIDYFGFEFDLEKYENPTCQKQHFSVRYTAASTPANLQLPMYSCPKMFFIDLETDKKTFWRYNYQISEAEERHSAFVFFQDPFKAEIYPQKLLGNIDFAAAESKSHQENGNELVSSTGTNTHMQFYKKPLREINYKYIKAKKLTAGYRKFDQLFKSISICSLYRSHKIHICRKALNIYNSDIEVNVEGYNEQTCKLHHLKILNVKGNFKMFVFRCPLAVKEFLKGIHFYISSSSISNGVTLYSRVNQSRAELIAELYTNHLNIFALVKDTRRVKLLPYPLKSEINQLTARVVNEKIEEELNIMENVQMPLNSLTGPAVNYIEQEAIKKQALIINNKWLVDEFLIIFSRIKTSKFVYQKFVHMYGSVNICKLSGIQKQNLCNNLLRSNGYELKPNHSPAKLVSYPCSINRITMVLREAENLRTNNFTIWVCPHFIGGMYLNRPLYFVGKSHIRDTVFIFKSHDEMTNMHMKLVGMPRPNGYKINNIYPDAIITKII